MKREKKNNNNIIPSPYYSKIFATNGCIEEELREEKNKYEWMEQIIKVSFMRLKAKEIDEEKKTKEKK